MRLGKQFLLDVSKVILASVLVTFILTLSLFLMLYGHPRNYDLGINLGLVMSIFIPAVISGPVAFYIFQQREKIRKINAELNLLIRFDPLTSLLTRRSFFEEGYEAIAASKLEKQSYAVFFIDIDHFKNINDTYGHAMGDNVLKCFGDIMSDLLKPEEILGRIGGEEFCLIGTNYSKNEACQRAKYILDEYRKRMEYIGEIHISSTISIGISVSNSNDLDLMINDADSQLYKAKHSGRDCFALSDKETHGTCLAA